MGSDRSDRYPPATWRERLPVTGLLIALGLSVAGAGSFLVGSSLPGPGLRLVGANQPLNAGAANPLDLTAHNSPTVVRNPVDPTNVVVANRIDTPSFSCALHVSKDDAATWEQIEIPFPPGEELPPRCFAPDVAFGADGTLYLSFVTLSGPGNTPNAVWLTSSSDGGTTLSAPGRVLGPLAFQVRLTAHPQLAGRLHLTWLQASTAATLAFPEPANPILAARSNDGGATWLPPVQVNTPSRQRVVAASSVVGTDDRVYVVYLDLRDDRLDYHGGHEGKGGPPYPDPWSLVLARSSDGGVTWQESVVEDAVVPTERVIVFFPPAPSLALDHQNGRVYVAFHDGRRGSADVWVWTSDDEGASFTAPVKVNDTGDEDKTSQYLPKLGVAPDGRLDVVYYDRRADPADVMNEVSLQSSFDRAQSFVPRLRLSDASFSSRVGFGSERGMPDLGSRLGLVSSNVQAVAVWPDTRSGTEASNKQDLARAIASVSDGSPLRGPLRVAGLAAGVVGFLVLASLVVLARNLRQQ